MSDYAARVKVAEVKRPLAVCNLRPSSRTVNSGYLPVPVFEENSAAEIVSERLRLQRNAQEMKV